VAPAAWFAGGRRDGRAVAVAGVVALVAWYYYHRTANDMSWAALLPLAVAVGGWRPALLGFGVRAYVLSNVVLAALLQAVVRPAAAREFFTLPAGYGQALEWLDRNTAPDSVVVTNGWASDYLLRAYTHNLGLGAVDWWSGTSRQERQRRHIVRSAVYAVPPATIARLLDERPSAIVTFKANVTERWIGDAEMDSLSERQGEYHFTVAEYEPHYAMSLPDLLSVYQADYIWVGPWEREVGQRDFERCRETTLVFENELVQIFRIDRDRPLGRHDPC
jgi:hypothetical protein